MKVTDINIRSVGVSEFELVEMHTQLVLTKSSLGPCVQSHHTSSSSKERLRSLSWDGRAQVYTKWHSGGRCLPMLGERSTHRASGCNFRSCLTGTVFRRTARHILSRVKVEVPGSARLVSERLNGSFWPFPSGWLLKPIATLLCRNRANPDLLFRSLQTRETDPSFMLYPNPQPVSWFQL